MRQINNESSRDNEMLIRNGGHLKCMPKRYWERVWPAGASSCRHSENEMTHSLIHKI